MTGAGERLKEARKSLNLSQKEIATTLNISQSYCAKIESNVNELKPSYLVALFEKFNISPLWLLVGQKPIILLDKDKYATYAKEVGERIKSARRKSLQLAVDFSVGLNADIEEIEKGEYLADPYTLLKIAYFISSDKTYQTFIYLLTGEQVSIKPVSISFEQSDFELLTEKYESIKKDLNITDSKQSYEILRSIINAKLAGGNNNDE